MLNKSSTPLTLNSQGPFSLKLCGIFGVACEAMSTQVNDEADTIGKGANATISLVHHYLQTHEHQVKYLPLTCGVGQNKNNYMIQYLMWRTLAGTNQNVKLSFIMFDIEPVVEDLPS